MKQEIPWNKFVVEAFVIVGSILLAFAIDAWWDERQERAHHNSHDQADHAQQDSQERRDDSQNIAVGNQPAESKPDDGAANATHQQVDEQEDRDHTFSRFGPRFGSFHGR